MSAADRAKRAALIERAAQLTLRLATADAAVAEARAKVERASETHLATTNTLGRVLRQLGPAVARDEAAPRHTRHPQSERT